MPPDVSVTTRLRAASASWLPPGRLVEESVELAGATLLCAAALAALGYAWRRATTPEQVDAEADGSAPLVPLPEI